MRCRIDAHGVEHVVDVVDAGHDAMQGANDDVIIVIGC